MGIISRFRRCASGSTSVEFAIVGLVFFILSIGIIEFGRGLWIRTHISHAADVGARTLLLNASATATELENATRDAFVHGDPTDLVITITTEDVAGVTYRRIRVQYPLSLWLPGLTTSVVNFDLERRIPVV